MKVLLVEDDKLLGESLKVYLQEHGIQVDHIYDPREVFGLLEFSIYDVIVLDLIMPHIPGEKLLRDLRTVDKKTPILVLTAKSRIEDKENCFNAGADDYIVKPFEPKELLLRLKALYKRKVGNTLLRIGSVDVDFEKEKVWVSGKPINLSKKDWLLFKFLVENRGRFVSSEEILNYVWGGQAVGDEVVRAHIKNLRKLLPEGFIISMKGRGYKVEA
ncbi:response regulator transcription factor [Hydrogenobacter hydrogenophilus]|uniref:DNA-binding response regulator, OmpR family, contains REC and winged-helix (WHTH) domain n=1 Tax=Hydrogenobacter hydrogenophilus TaxID=35835 RepID=A0A285NRK2_9AQUI|nr:response regulator transcription factor [Hydrogenobacter hydrogenophilus]SNZ12154.1 DNA-binding response regulator, OmpR family, contains REC and winged-helix (wHTH) domain [Hydrogenobacter hydrogenophilus]